MSNRRKLRHSNIRQDVTLLDGRKPPSAYTPAELRRMLVTDGVKRYIGGTQELAYLRWFTAAITRIGGETGPGAEQAIKDLDAEVYALCGQHLRLQ